MKKRLLITVCLLALVAVAPAGADPQGTKTIARVLDPVIVTGGACGLTGQPVAHYGLYAFKDNQLRPIPFQIDEKNKDGQFVLAHGKKAAPDEDPAFDDNDELVFMAMDTGDRLSDQTLLPSGFKACAELAVTDPVTQATAWVYLAVFDSPPEKSSIDYVAYGDGGSSFRTRNYSVGFDDGHPVGASKYAFEKGVGGDGDNFIDRIKVRVIMRAMGVTLHRNEEDIKVQALGYIDGPVRVIVFSKNVTSLMLGIGASTTTQYTYYYSSFANFAFAVAFPLRPSLFHATIIDDFKDAKGWGFYNSNNPDGHVIDGMMDATDAKLDLSPWKWSALSNGKQCFWSIWRAPAGCPVKASLYFNDNANAEDKMEDKKGELPGIGFDFNKGWDQLNADSVEFRLIHFYTQGYQKGMETDICNVYDVPLKVTATALKNVGE
ncbi:MAG: hypothetical protein M0036_11305 [Desulfobacteraceae bacterium]|nr:hypothetical protein [Desulfobacteraceae bacterium]